MFKLTIEDDEGKTTVVPLIRDEMTIGRLEGNTIRLTERNVSRKHARLRAAERRALHRGSRELHRRACQRDAIATATPLREGDEVQIGDYELTLRGERAGRAAPIGDGRRCRASAAMGRWARWAARSRSRRAPRSPRWPRSPPARAAVAIPRRRSSRRHGAVAGPAHRRRAGPCDAAGCRGAAAQASRRRRSTPRARCRGRRRRRRGAARRLPAQRRAPRRRRRRRPRRRRRRCRRSRGVRGAADDPDARARRRSRPDRGRRAGAAVRAHDRARGEGVPARSRRRWSSAAPTRTTSSLNHRSISRHHAKIVRDGDHYTIVDLQSANGVRVNGEDYERIELNPGDIVELGHVKLRFVGPFETFVFEPQSRGRRLAGADRRRSGLARSLAWSPSRMLAAQPTGLEAPSRPRRHRARRQRRRRRPRRAGRCRVAPARTPRRRASAAGASSPRPSRPPAPRTGRRRARRSTSWARPRATRRCGATRSTLRRRVDIERAGRRSVRAVRRGVGDEELRRGDGALRARSRPTASTSARAKPRYDEARTLLVAEHLAAAEQGAHRRSLRRGEDRGRRGDRASIRATRSRRRWSACAARAPSRRAPARPRAARPRRGARGPAKPRPSPTFARDRSAGAARRGAPRPRPPARTRRMPTRS